MLSSLSMKINLQGDESRPASFPDSDYLKEKSSNYENYAFRLHGATCEQKNQRRKAMQMQEDERNVWENLLLLSNYSFYLQTETTAHLALIWVNALTSTKFGYLLLL